MKDFQVLKEALPIPSIQDISSALFLENSDVFVSDSIGIKELAQQSDKPIKEVRKVLKDLVKLGFLKQIYNNRFLKNPFYFNVSISEEQYKEHSIYQPKSK